MTQDKRFKKLVRARAKKMGTTYMVALSTMLPPEVRTADSVGAEASAPPLSPSSGNLPAIEASEESSPLVAHPEPRRMWNGRLDYQERKWRRFEQILARVPLDRWECFGLIARDYPGSLYKLSLRCGKARWWSFDFGPGAGQSAHDPVAYQRRLNPEHALPRECVVHGPLSLLAGLTCHPEKPALVRALALAKEKAKDNSVSSPTPPAPKTATVLASKPKSDPQREPICGVLFVHGRPTWRSPFGQSGVGSICHHNIVGDAMNFRSLTNKAGDVTCGECRAVLGNGGFCTEQSQMCDDCSRYPSEGHDPTCRFVTVYGMSTEPREQSMHH